MKKGTFSMTYTYIFDSSLMEEDVTTRLVFHYLCVAADKDHMVTLTVQGMARKFNLSPEDIQRGLERLSSPDPLSRDTDFEGRRIQQVGVGTSWRVLNRGKFTAYGQREVVQEKKAESNARHRSGKNLSKAKSPAQAQEAIAAPEAMTAAEEEQPSEEAIAVRPTAPRRMPPAAIKPPPRGIWPAPVLPRAASVAPAAPAEEAIKPPKVARPAPAAPHSSVVAMTAAATPVSAFAARAIGRDPVCEALVESWLTTARRHHPLTPEEEAVSVDQLRVLWEAGQSKNISKTMKFATFGKGETYPQFLWRHFAEELSGRVI